ncbi:hypothetical protein IHN63_06325 [Deinococcus sp. 6YEL10]|uniref:hypothetical protein n=1 Tax=Deinococcus sp. 6YEL10 TaxID=2745870 RepID=UPI001E2C137F|nr:hypothetical protein [Deinococcus sp. 6YEL10]MCD0160926.1 hypothetical protein [Deinococcus sp. 6YEL10]
MYVLYDPVQFPYLGWLLVAAVVVAVGSPPEIHRPQWLMISLSTPIGGHSLAA